MAATGGASGNAVTFTSSGACSNSGATYTMTSGTGTCSVIANQAGNCNYAAAPQVTKISNRDSGHADHHVHHEPTGERGLQEQLHRGGHGRRKRERGDLHEFRVVQQFGATYTMTSGTGTCSVIANQAGNSNYSAAPQVTCP